MANDDGICELNMADFRAIAALWREAKMWPHVGENRAWLEAALARNPGLFLVYKEKGRVIGTALSAWDGLRGWVYRLAVKKQHRGRGIGTRLLAEVEKRLRAAGARQVNLMVWAGNGQARDFYLQRGYERSSALVLRKRFGSQPLRMGTG
jgi:ribosomal protein S18 acetylase RimI-like enzyme